MSQVFRLPDLGEGLTEAEVVQWHVAEGDEVVVDQEVVTVETAKASVDVPCPYAGTVTTLHAAPGRLLAVGEPLITVAPAGVERYRTEERAGSSGGPAEESGAVLIGYGTGRAGTRRSRRRRSASGAGTGSRGPGAVRVISPLVRRMAVEAGLDLAAVRATGPGGVIRRADVESALGPDASAPPRGAGAPTGAAPVVEETRVPLTGIRRLTADKLSRSRREIPDATTWVDVDATELVAARDALQRLRPGDGIGTLALLARITLAGLARFPELNSSVDVEAAEIVRHDRVNLGVAVQSPRGLVVPVVRGADRLSTAQLAAQLGELTTAARQGTLRPGQLTGGTFTLNNYGVFGVDGSTPIINHPEAAMLGVGRIADRPWAHQGQVALRRVAQLSFTFDHRVCDGGTAGGFLRFVADCVEQPAVLLGEL